MRKFIEKWGMVAASSVAGLFVATTIVRCGDSNPSGNYVQVERLARPAINEGLVVTPSYLTAFNSISPAIDLTTAASQVVGEAAAVLGALYLGSCYAVGQILGTGTDPTAADSPKPGGHVCQDASSNSLYDPANIFVGGTPTGGVKAAAQTAADSYATAMAGYFLPDVLRIDTTVTSMYVPDGTPGAGALCDSGNSGSPLLCGGRYPTNDVMDDTYLFLLSGYPAVAVNAGYLPVFRDGVDYGGTGGAQHQGHSALRGTFPYIPAPYDI